MERILPIKKTRVKKPRAKKITVTESSAKNGYIDFNVRILKKKDPQLQLKGTETLMQDLLIEKLKQLNGMKINISLQITFYKDPDKRQDAFFKTKAGEIINENDINEAISEARNELLNRISELISQGSGWMINTVDKHELTVIKYMPIKVHHIFNCQQNIEIVKKD